MVKDVNPWYRIINVIQGTTEPDDSDISELTVAGDKIFFFARNGSVVPYTDSELGSQMVQRKGQKQDLANGMFYQTLTQAVPFIGRNLDWYTGPRELTAVGDRVFSHQWLHIGIPTKTGKPAARSSGYRMEQNLGPGWSKHTSGHGIWPIGWRHGLLRRLDRSSPRSLTLAGENLYFTADNGQRGGAMESEHRCSILQLRRSQGQGHPSEGAWIKCLFFDGCR